MTSVPQRSRGTDISVAAALRTAAAELEPIAGSGRLDATLLLEHVTGSDRIAFVRDGERVLEPAERDAFDALVARRRGGIPIPYLTGTAGFYGRTFAVDERVLVPRPETEHLVDAALEDLRARGPSTAKVADIGTGSGAIAIVLAAELPDAWIFGTDVSQTVLTVARRNAARNNVFQQCTFLHGDLAAPLVRFGPFDCIVANLPYVPTAEIGAPPDPVGFEPRLALDGGADGLVLYRRLLPQLPPLTTPHASIFLEAGPSTVEPLAGLVRSAFRGRRVTIGDDYGGRGRYVAVRD
jgi:release factor glutamine methyltransferase